jgi:hypothetical protein
MGCPARGLTAKYSDLTGIRISDEITRRSEAIIVIHHDFTNAFQRKVMAK